MDKSPSNRSRNSYEPVFLNARREALVTIAVWIIGLAWTVGYCFVTGYDVSAEQIKATLGVPNWIFWGVLVPWILVILFTVWFGLFYIADDKLTAGQDESYQSPLSQQRPEPEKEEISQ